MSVLKTPVTAEDHIQGNDNAAITLVEYGDYECPYCGLAYLTIKRIQQYFGENLRFVFRNFPLTEAHPNAEIAAETAEFAGDHNRFWQMHDLLYENQSHLNLPLLISLTKILKLPVDELENALEKRIYLPKIKKDFMSGVRSGVNGTPTFFINGHHHIGSFEFENLVTAINQAIK